MGKAPIGIARLAKKYGKLTTGGSDSHKSECVGRGYTILPEPVSCETELISLIHKKTPLKTGGVLYNKTTKEKIGKINKFLVYSFWVYNKSGELLKRHGRNKKWKRSIHLIRSTRSNYIIIRNTFRMEGIKESKKKLEIQKRLQCKPLLYFPGVVPYFLLKSRLK